MNNTTVLRRTWLHKRKCKTDDTILLCLISGIQFAKQQLFGYLREGLGAHWTAEAEVGWDIALTAVVGIVNKAYLQPDD